MFLRAHGRLPFASDLAHSSASSSSGATAAAERPKAGETDEPLEISSGWPQEAIPISEPNPQTSPATNEPAPQADIAAETIEPPRIADSRPPLLVGLEALSAGDNYRALAFLQLDNSDESQAAQAVAGNTDLIAPVIERAAPSNRRFIYTCAAIVYLKNHADKSARLLITHLSAVAAPDHATCLALGTAIAAAEHSDHTAEEEANWYPSLSAISLKCRVSTKAGLRYPYGDRLLNADDAREAWATFLARRREVQGAESQVSGALDALAVLRERLLIAKAAGSHSKSDNQRPQTIRLLEKHITDAEARLASLQLSARVAAERLERTPPPAYPDHIAIPALGLRR
jgi:hypothetical protein